MLRELVALRRLMNMFDAGKLVTIDVLAYSIRKLPHQVDNSKLEIPVLNVLGMNSMGVLLPRESWGLNSL